MENIQKKLSLPVIFSVVFLDMLGVSIVIPILAPLLISSNAFFDSSVIFQTRTIVLGFLLASYPLAQFFGAPLLGALSDNVGRKKILQLSQLGTLIGYLLFAVGIMTGDIVLLFVSRILDGFTGGNISIIYSSIADISDKKSKVKNFGLVGMAFGLGFIVGPYIGGKLSDPEILNWFTFATPFWISAILAFINIIMVQFLFIETLRHTIKTKLSLLTGMRNLKRAWRLVNLRTMFLVVFFIAFGFSFFTQFFQVFLIEKFQFNQSQIGNLFAYMGIWIAMVQGTLVRPLAKRFEPKQILSVTILCLSLVFPLYFFTTASWQLFFIVPLLAIFNGLTQPNTNAVVSNLSDQDSQGEIMGINQSINSLALFLPPLIAGLVASIHIYLPILLAAVSSFVAWVIYIKYYHNDKKDIFHEV